MDPIGLFFRKTVSPINAPNTLNGNFSFPPTQCQEIPYVLDTPFPHNKETPYYFEKTVSQNIIEKEDLEIPSKVGVDAISSRPMNSIVLEQAGYSMFPSMVTEINSRIDLMAKVRVFGMNYKNRIWHEVTSNKEPPIQPLKLVTRPFTKSYLELEKPTEKRTSKKTTTPSFWDLVYALLQPPIMIGEIDNLFLPHDLYPFQITGVQFLMDNDCALLADEMGTGKTVQAVVALRILIQKAKIRSALIICPVSVLRQWDEHIRLWAPELLVTVVRGNISTRKIDWSMPAHIYITGYDTLRNDIESEVLPQGNLNKFDVVVLDEAQCIKNAESGRAKFVRKLKPGRRWALTGTPIENRIEDAISIFSFLKPGYLLKEENIPAIVKKKISPYFLRRRKADVLKDLPPKILQEFWLELDEAQREAYNKVFSEGRTELGSMGNKVNKIAIFRVLTKLKQICNFAPGQTTSPKLSLLLEHVEPILESGQKVIVFSQFISEGIEKIIPSLKPYGLAKVVGGQSDRDTQIQQFQQSDQIPILLASVRAGGVGLNLQVASYVIHFDHWWNPAVMWQAEDRAHRQGQKRIVNVFSYWVADTIEEKIYQTLKNKGILFAEIVDGLSETDIDEVITTEEWLDMLGVKHKGITSPLKNIPLNLSVTEIQARLQQIPPNEFERVAKDLLHALGYPNSKVMGHTRDGGVDVESIRNTPNGVVKVIAQCKRYQGTVGVEVARALMGVIASDDKIEKGYLVTTGEISKECMAFCVRSGVIVALDGIQTANYVRKFGVKI